MSVKELKRYNVKLLLNSETNMTYLNSKISQGIWLNVYLSLFLVIFLKLNNLVIEPNFIDLRPLGADLIFSNLINQI